MPTPTQNPFRRAEATDKRLKVFLWGDAGAGKTTLALRFPAPVVLDFEGSTDLYGGAFTFDVLKPASPDEAMTAIEWLLTHEHPYKTLVIDPITVYWDALQKKWSDIYLKRTEAGKKGNRYEFYDLQPKDWMTLKAELKEFLRKVLALDMNVVVTARQKTQYADGQFMRAIGETFDGEKTLPYLFDVILHMRREHGKFIAEAIKDRSAKLPTDPFEITYAKLAALYGQGTLERTATPRPEAVNPPDAPPPPTRPAPAAPPNGTTTPLASPEQRERIGELRHSLGLPVAPADIRRDAGRFLGRLLTTAEPMRADEARRYIAHLDAQSPEGPDREPGDEPAQGDLIDAPRRVGV